MSFPVKLGILLSFTEKLTSREKSAERFYLRGATAISHQINKPAVREGERRAAIKSVKFHRIT